MLALLDEKTRERILTGVAASQPGLATQLRKKMLRFEDLTELEVVALQRFFPMVPSARWALALRGLDEAVARKLLSVIPARASQLILEERELIGPRPIRDVELARDEICEKARALGLLPLSSDRGRKPSSRG
jgi:flagellar motor switch protein FliG